MKFASKRLVLLSSAALIVFSVGVEQASAGGFAVREQSAYGQGTSFAGVAAGGALSSMFWNPAVMTQFRGFAAEIDAAAIFGNASNTWVSGSSAGGVGGTGNIANAAIVPSGYASYQLTRDIWVGMGINSPFGLSVTFPDGWAGRAYGRDSSLKTYNFNPAVAWQATNWLSIGVGFQAQYANATLSRGVLAPTLFTQLGGTGWGYGATAGINIKAGPQTDIGLGWRSAINQKIDGALTTNFGALIPTSTFGGVSTTINMPDIVSLGIRHRIDPQWTVMGTVEWTNWSRIGTSTVTTSAGGAALVAGTAVTLPFQYRDGWFFSLGAEYVWTPQTTVRAGIAFERSPITDAVRIPILPDNDRLWLSAGLSHRLNQNVILDLAYSHVWVKDPNINITAASGNPWFSAASGSYVGTVSASVDIVSVALRFQLAPEPPATKLITK